MMMEERGRECAPGRLSVGPKLPPISMNSGLSLGMGGDVREEGFGKSIRLNVPLRPVVELFIRGCCILMAVDMPGDKANVGDVRPEIVDHTEKIVVRLLGLDWMWTECSVESTLRVACDVNPSLGEAVDLMEGVDESNNTQDTTKFTAVGGAKYAAGVSRRGLVNAASKDGVGVAKVAEKECRGAKRRFPGAVAHCFDRAVPEAVGKEGVGRGEVKMLDRPPGDRRQVSNKRLNIMGEGE